MTITSTPVAWAGELGPAEISAGLRTSHEEIERNPGDGRSVFYLGQSYYCLDDFANSLKWYARRTEMGGWDEELYFSLVRVAESKCGSASRGRRSLMTSCAPGSFAPVAPKRCTPSPTTSAKPRIINWHICSPRWLRRFHFQWRTSCLSVRRCTAGMPTTRSPCASWIGKPVEAFTYWRRTLASIEVPDEDRRRIAGNRDLVVPPMIELAQRKPDVTVFQSDGDVTVTVVAGPDGAALERTVTTFLNCCSDSERIGGFVVIDAGLSCGDRAHLGQCYSFLEFRPFYEHSRDHIKTRFWLHLGQGWQFFAPRT